MKWRREEGGKNGRLSVFPCVCVGGVQPPYPHLFNPPFIARSLPPFSLCENNDTGGNPLLASGWCRWWWRGSGGGGSAEKGGTVLVMLTGVCTPTEWFEHVLDHWLPLRGTCLVLWSIWQCMFEILRLYTYTSSIWKNSIIYPILEHPRQNMYCVADVESPRE